MEHRDDHEQIASRIEALESELELIARFEWQIACGPSVGYEIAVGTQARRLRSAEIIRELKQLERQARCQEQSLFGFRNKP